MLAQPVAGNPPLSIPRRAVTRTMSATHATHTQPTLTHTCHDQQPQMALGWAKEFLRIGSLPASIYAR
jgi:hypothetical protein